MRKIEELNERELAIALLEEVRAIRQHLIPTVVSNVTAVQATPAVVTAGGSKKKR